MNFKNEFKQNLKKSLAMKLPYEDRTQRHLKLLSSPKSAAVLVLFRFESDESEPSVLFILRTENSTVHQGQMAFPGGRVDSEDEGNFSKTALRETWEEVGISPDEVEVIGELPFLQTVTGFQIKPMVGILKKTDVILKMNPNEVADMIWVPFTALKSSEVYRKESIEYENQIYPLHVFYVENYKIWGATGSMIKNLLDRLGSQK